jgi:hypothetical protein
LYSSVDLITECIPMCINLRVTERLIKPESYATPHALG